MQSDFKTQRSVLKKEAIAEYCTIEMLGLEVESLYSYFMIKVFVQVNLFNLRKPRRYVYDIICMHCVSGMQGAEISVHVPQIIILK